MGMRFTLAELKLADELCLHDRFLELAKKHFGEGWHAHHWNFRRKHECKLNRFLFEVYSRADFKKPYPHDPGNTDNETLHNRLDRFICDLLGKDYIPD